MCKCEICGRETFKKIKYKGYILCSKHMHQLNFYGYFKDNNPRSANDMNNYRIDYKNNIVIFDVYNQSQEKNGEFIIDLDDIEMVKYHKWRSSYGHIVTGNNTNKNPTMYLARFLLNCTDSNLVVDHINGNPYDNRKCNLRICTQGENTYNKSHIKRNTTGFIGVHPESRENRITNWCTEIRYNKKRIHLGAYEKLEDAVYARWLAELILFGQYRNSNNDQAIFEQVDLVPSERKSQISEYVSRQINLKLQRI